jgi:protein-tyrosine phosphatase
MTAALSLLNFRDLGGLPVEGGRRLRPRMLYRNEGPANLKDHHRSELAALGIRLVCDLRSDVERSIAPNDWQGDARLLNLDITADLRSDTNEGWLALQHDPSAAGAKRAMQTNYAMMPGAMLPHLGLFVELMLAGEMPVLIHCTAGKDRTGVLVALLLRLLGVPHEAVIADYKRSDIFGQNLLLAGSVTHAFEESFGFAPSEETMATMIGVDPDFLSTAIDTVEARWGSIDGYFAAAGINDARRAALRRLLTIEAA